ncbi:MAG: MoaD/ThiS family protein [Thermoplasmata archaeon]|nr:MoaD/ThiS family protein [Thermoplasmata archaeon]
MRVSVTYMGSEKELDLGEGATVLDAMKTLGVPPDVTIALMGGRPVPEDRPLSDGERLEMVTVVSGG